MLEYCCGTHWYQNFCALHKFQADIEFTWELILDNSSNVNVMKDNGGKPLMCMWTALFATSFLT